MKKVPKANDAPSFVVTSPTEVIEYLKKIDQLNRRNKNLLTENQRLKEKVERSKKDSKFPEALSFSSLEDWFNAQLSQLKPRNKTGVIPKDRTVGILLIDGDDYGSVNKLYSLTAGNRLIRQTVRVLKSHIKKRDLLFRWGGDEFVIILNGKQTNQSIHRAVLRLSQLLMTIEVGSEKVSRTISVSGDLFTLTHKKTIDFLSQIENKLSIANNEVKELKRSISPSPEKKRTIDLLPQLEERMSTNEQPEPGGQSIPASPVPLPVTACLSDDQIWHIICGTLSVPAEDWQHLAACPSCSCRIAAIMGG